MFSSKTIKPYVALLLAIFALTAISGCGKQQGGERPPTAVKAIKVIKHNANTFSEYAGQVQGKNEAKVQARVTGNVVEKLVSGGETVAKGQALFRIDSRQYESSLLSARANLAESQVRLNTSKLDTQRYRELYKASAISEQQLTNQEAAEKQYQALVDANYALTKKAQDDLDDTVVTSPIDGRLYVDDVSVGTFVVAGQTTLVTVGSVDPINVEFNMSETDYLALREQYPGNIDTNGWGNIVEITLSNGQKYPFTGTVTQVDKGLANNSGTLTIKATMPNPNAVLIPGMFARVKITGTPIKGALLVPQRSIQQVLDKSFVMVITSENKAEARQVTLGKKIGSFWIVEEGLEADETVVVEGLTNLQSASSLAVTIVTPDELGLLLE